MALVWVEGFENYNVGALSIITTEMQDKYVLTGIPRLETGRLGGFAGGSAGTFTFRTPIFTSAADWIVGFAYRLANTSGGTISLVNFCDNASIESTLSLNSANQLSFHRGGAAGTILKTAAFAFKINVWYYIEVKGSFTTLGSYEVKINNQVIPSISDAGPIDTTATPATSINNFIFNSAVSGNQFDDIYICDTTTAFNTTYRGDSRVIGLNPNAAGASSVWTPSGGGGNFEQVDDILDGTAADNNSSYVSSATPGDKDTYNYEDFSSKTSIATYTIYGTQVNTSAAKDEVGSRTIASIARSGVTEAAGASYALPTLSGAGTEYAYQPDVFQLDPATSALWTIAGIDSAQFGISLIS